MFIMEMMVGHFFIRIPFRLIKFVVGASFGVWVMVNLICSDCDPVQVLDIKFGQISA